MRWATFRTKEAPETDRVGLVVDGKIHALEAGARLIDLLGDLPNAGERARGAGAEIHEVDAVRLRPPIPNPPSIRDFSSFLDHYRIGITNQGLTFNESWFQAPVFYFTSPNNLVGHDDLVRVPGETRKMDYELEICAIIGKECVDLDPAQAEQAIAGYCIFNDWSARDIQSDEMLRAPIGPGKGKDSANGFGPYLVTPDELEDTRAKTGYTLAMTARVNGREYSRGNCASLYWSFAEMVAYSSRNSRLVPGDIIGAGTVGTGCILELAGTHGSAAFPWLQEGDEVVLEIERLGRLRNRVTWGKPPKPLREIEIA